MKKRIDIHGTLEFPLVIGCAAFIWQSVGELIWTSPVKHFIRLPSGVTYTGEATDTVANIVPPTVLGAEVEAEEAAIAEAQSAEAAEDKAEEAAEDGEKKDGEEA